MQNPKLSSKFQNYKVLGLVLGAILVLSLFLNIWLIKERKNSSNFLSSQTNSVLTKPVSGKEIYPLFECPCCGKPLDQCSCPMSKERSAYIDGLIETTSSKDRIILAYVKKYGLNSFMDKEKQNEFREKLTKEAPTNRPIISLNPDSYDFGNVSQKEGVVTTFFELRNEGEKDLVIKRLETSCGCTSASIVFQEEEGPRFSMPGHGINEKIGDWQVVIAPGKTAKVKVYYDPNVHEDFRGEAIREIYVYSNDPIDFQKSVSIELNQVP